jgi:hypothetical protein
MAKETEACYVGDATKPIDFRSPQVLAASEEEAMDIGRAGSVGEHDDSAFAQWLRDEYVPIGGGWEY